MTRVVFYQKPGCAGNGRQRAMLLAAGHEVEGRDLLTEPWTAARLRPFFGQRPVVEWFNPAAPRIKSGEIDPARFDADAALALLVAEPLLIRRPLIEADGQCCAGFDLAPVPELLGAAPGPELQGCAHDRTGGAATCAGHAES